MATPNPFQPAPGASPPELVGRDAEVSSILDATDRIKSGSAPTPIVFTGLRGIGKTVLLNRLIELAGPKAVVLKLEVESDVSLDAVMQDAAARLMPALRSVPRRLLSSLDAALRQLPKLEYGLPHELGSLSVTAPPDEETRHLPLRAALSSLNDAIAAVNRFLVITIDEIHDVDVASLRTVAAVVHQSAGTSTPILLSCAGLPQTSEIIKRLRTYAHRWEHYALDLLTRAEAAQAIRLPIERAGAFIEIAALDFLVRESAGYPFFVQKYASAAWNVQKNGRIRAVNVESVLPGVRASIEKTFYGDAFDDLSPRERVFALALAELGPGAHELRSVAERLGTSSPALGSIRTRLIKKNVVFVPRAGALAFRIPLAERYLIDHRDEYETADVVAYRSQLGRAASPAD
jgi:hypothetical protein